MESVSPTLAGRFLTTGSPGKPSMVLLTWVQICDTRDDNSSRSGLSGCSRGKEEVLVCAVRGPAVEACLPVGPQDLFL